MFSKFHAFWPGWPLGPRKKSEPTSGSHESATVQLHREDNILNGERTFDKELSGALCHAGRVGGATREDARVLNQHFSDGKHELVPLT